MKKILASALLALFALGAHAELTIGKTEMYVGKGTGKPIVTGLDTPTSPCIEAVETKPVGTYRCEVSVVKKATPTPPGDSWVQCAQEGGTCSLTGMKKVRYGVSPTVAGKYNELTVTGPVSCNNATFGDPALTFQKTCWASTYAGGSTPPPVDPPPGGGTGVPPVADRGLPVVGAIVATAGQVISGVHVTTASGPCITVNVPDVTIRDSEIGPCGPTETGKGIDVQSGAVRLTVQRNYIHDISTGLYANGAKHPIIFDRNQVTNIRGPFPRGQLVQFNGVKTGTQPSSVTCNVAKLEGLAPANRMMEDGINMYDSPGVGPGANRTVIAYNYISGGHPTSNSGTAIMGGDGPSGGNLWIHHNVAVNTRNVGIGIAGGSNIDIEDNRVYQHKDSTYVNIATYSANYSGVPGSCNNHNWRRNRTWALNSNNVQNNFWHDGNCSPVVRDSNVTADGTLSPSMINETMPAPCQ